jgi:hypothetical protein
MRGHGCKLPRLLRDAVEAYLEEPTFARAAARTGIARSTLFVWAKLPEFRQFLDQIRHARGLKLFGPPGAQRGGANHESGRSLGGGVIAGTVGPAAARRAC